MILRPAQDHSERGRTMTILGIETSCDETSAAIVSKKSTDTFATVHTNIIATSLALHAKTGGIIPETAAREQIKYILPVIQEALQKGLDFKIKKNNIPPIDAIAVTYGPGLIGSLLVGVETAKTLSYVWNKPLIPVNHLIGHIYANWLQSTDVILSLTENPDSRFPENDQRDIPFPALALIVSGGHTDLVLIKQHGNLKVIGGTRDDAAGEAFDKIGRLLGLPYPAGPFIEQKAKKGDPKRFIFPRPLIGSTDFDFSFSGLKSAVFREVQNLQRHSGLSRIDSGVANAPQNDRVLDEKTICDISRGVQDAIIAVLVKKTMKAAKAYNAKSILLSGGVAANQMLRDTFEQTTNDQRLTTKLFAPAKNLCTDNAAMIATAAFYNPKKSDWKTLTANPELYFEE